MRRLFYVRASWPIADASAAGRIDPTIHGRCSPLQKRVDPPRLKLPTSGVLVARPHSCRTLPSPTQLPHAASLIDKNRPRWRGRFESIARWTRTQRIRTAARIPVQAVIIDGADVPVFLRIADKAKHLSQLGMSDRAIARALGVSDKTVAKSAMRSASDLR